MAAPLQFLLGTAGVETLAPSVEVPCPLGWPAALVRKPGPSAETDGNGSLWPRGRRNDGGPHNNFRAIKEVIMRRCAHHFSGLHFPAPGSAHALTLSVPGR